MQGESKDGVDKRRGGARPGAGRPKNARSGSVKTVTESFEAAFRALGGTPGLVKWGKKDPGAFYKLFARRLPAAVEVDAQVDGNVTVELVKFTDEGTGKA